MNQRNGTEKLTVEGGWGKYINLVIQVDLPEEMPLEHLRNKGGIPRELWVREMANARTQSPNPLIFQLRKLRPLKRSDLEKRRRARAGILFSRLIGSDTSYTNSHLLNSHVAKSFKVHENTWPWIVKEKRHSIWASRGL